MRFPTPSHRVQCARYFAVTAGSLDWSTRVLLAAAEAADAVVSPFFRDAVACAIADKCGDAVAELRTVSALNVAVRDAISAAGLEHSVSDQAAYKLVWRLVFDMWGGPVR